MESRIIQLTQAALDHGNLNLSSCGKDFFPSDVYGSSSKKKSPGKPITLILEGLKENIKTDIPKEKNNKHKRNFLRERTWIKKFVRINGLIPGDTVQITHISNRTYSIKPFERKTLTFIDLFAGIGGTRIAFEKAGCKCVFSSEWDRFAQITYEKNFGEKPTGDIKIIKSSEIPD